MGFSEAVPSALLLLSRWDVRHQICSSCQALVFKPTLGMFSFSSFFKSHFTGFLFFLTFLSVQEYVFFPLVTLTLLTWFLAFLWKCLGVSAMERMNQWTSSGSGKTTAERSVWGAERILWKQLGVGGFYYFPFSPQIFISSWHCCPEQMLPFLSVQKVLVPSWKDHTQNISVAAEEHTICCKLSVSGKLWACWAEGRFAGKVQVWPSEGAEQGGSQV